MPSMTYTSRGGLGYTQFCSDCHRPDGAIRAGHGPQALALTPDGRTLYVADILGGTVAVISLKG